MSTLWYIPAILLLLFGSAFFSAAEMSLSSANRLRLESAADGGSRRARAACAVLDRYDDALSAILIGNNLCNIASDALATVLTVTVLGARYTPAAAVVSTALMVAVIIVFCESAPKIMAKKNANRWSIAFSYTLRVLMVLLRPLIALVQLLIRVLTLPFRGEKPEDQQEEAAAELQSIIETVEDEGVIDEGRSEMLQAALDFSQVPVMDVMTARVDVDAIDVDDDWADILAAVESAPYSRIPVYEDSIDNVIGILYLNRFFKALLDGGKVDLRSLLMEPLYIYKTVKLPAVLNELRGKQQHLAIVTDEYGGTLGIVTMEDVLEEIVGDIWDETDEVEPEVVERPGGGYELDGDLPIGEFAELLDVSEESLDTESSTVGGWTIEKFGAFPKAGDSFTAGGWKLTVLTMDEDGLRVERVLVEKAPGPDKDKKES